MIWQDLVITSGLFIFAIALIPTVFGVTKPAPVSSLMTFVIQVTLAVTFATLQLWWSVASGLLLGSVWFVLWIQALRQRRQR